MTTNLTNLHQIFFEFVASSRGKEMVVEDETGDINIDDIDTEDAHVILEEDDLVIWDDLRDDLS